jgi:hypothetical protein
MKFGAVTTGPPRLRTAHREIKIIANGDEIRCALDCRVCLNLLCSVSVTGRLVCLAQELPRIIADSQCYQTKVVAGVKMQGRHVSLENNGYSGNVGVRDPKTSHAVILGIHAYNDMSGRVDPLSDPCVVTCGSCVRDILIIATSRQGYTTTGIEPTNPSVWKQCSGRCCAARVTFHL